MTADGQARMDDTQRRLKSLVQFHCKGNKWPSPIAGLTLFRSDLPFGPVRSLYDPRLCIVLQGRKRIEIEDTVIDIEPGHCLTVVLDLPVSASVVEARPAEPHLSLTIDLDPAAIADMVHATKVTGCKNPAIAAETGTGLATAITSDDLLEPVERLLRLLDRPADIATLAPLMQREILYRLLQGAFGPMLRELAASGSRLGRIAAATAFIRQNFDRQIEVAELATMARMSITNFHRAFKAATHMSPLQFRARLRLNEARRRLSLGETHIGRIAFDVGYRSQSQFNREYRKLFGEAPGRERDPPAASIDAGLAPLVSL
jgi:AraC-like DNA-binding protein